MQHCHLLLLLQLLALTQSFHSRSIIGLKAPHLSASDSMHGTRSVPITVHSPKLVRSALSAESASETTAGAVVVEEKKDDGGANEIVVLPPAAGIVKVVMKFGGSSLASADRVDYVCRLIQKHVEQGYKPIIVCSAMGKTTNTLINAGEFALSGQVSIVDSLRTMHTNTMAALGLPESTTAAINDLLSDLERLLEGIRYISELTPRTVDTLVSFGERMSVRIVAAYLNKLGVPAQAFDSWTIGMKTTGEYGNAEVLEGSYAEIKAKLSRFDGMMVPVVTGFIGKDCSDRITTLGRGGSDLTATVIGCALPADEVQVWKDVDGIMSADPRLVQNAVPVEAVTYEEAAELAFFGAEVLHPISMQPAIRGKIPVRVKNSYNPSAPGTVISNTRDKSNTLVTAITSKGNVQLIDIVSTRMLGQYGFLAKVFALFQQCKVSVDVIASSDVSLSLTLESKKRVQAQAPPSGSGDPNLDLLLSELRHFAEVRVVSERAIVSIICNLDRSSEVMASAFSVMAQEGVRVEMLSQGASKVNISFVVKMEDKDRLIRVLHAKFFE